MTAIYFIVTTAFAALLLAASSVKANVALTSGSNYSATAGVPNFDVIAGGSIDVPITVSEYGPTKEISSDGGLDGAGFLVSHSSPGVNDDSVITAVGIALASFPHLISSTYDDGSASVTMDVFPTDSLTYTPASISAGLLQLGTVTIQASSVVGQVSTYTIQDSGSTTSDTFLTDNGNELDSLLTPSVYTFTVTATDVPEPGCICLLALGGIAIRHRRRFTA